MRKAKGLRTCFIAAVGLAMLVGKPAVAVADVSCGARANVFADVPASIQGHVLDEKGRRIPGVTVIVHLIGEAEYPTPYQRTVMTDDKGEYRAGGLPRGRYYVSATPPDRGSGAMAEGERLTPSHASGFAPTFYAGTPWVADAQPVTVEAGDQVTGVDIVLVRKRLATISGRMTSSSGRLHDGAFVHLVPVVETQGAGLVGFSESSIVSGDGSFRIERVPPGEYELTARSMPLGDLRGVAETGSAPPHRPDNEVFMTRLVVDEEDIKGLELVVGRLGSIRGRLMPGSGPLTLPERRIRITALAAGAATSVGAVNPGEVQSNGAFEIAAPAGSYVMRTEDPHQKWALQRIERYGSDITDTGLMLGSGETVDDIVVVLTERPTGLHGRIVKQAGAEPPAYERCLAIVFSEDAQRWGLPDSRYLASTQVRSDGSFDIVGLPPGRYLTALVPTYDRERWRTPEYLQGVKSRGKRVELREGATTTVEMP